MEFGEGAIAVHTWAQLDLANRIDAIAMRYVNQESDFNSVVNLEGQG